MSMTTPVLAWGWYGLTPTILSIKSKSTKSTKILLTLATSLLHWRPGSWRSFALIRKEAGLSCGSFQRKGEVLAYMYAGINQTLKDLTPLGGVRPFHQKSSCLAQSIFRARCVANLVPQRSKIRAKKNLDLHRVEGGVHVGYDRGFRVQIRKIVVSFRHVPRGVQKI